MGCGEKEVISSSELWVWLGMTINLSVPLLEKSHTTELPLAGIACHVPQSPEGHAIIPLRDRWKR